MTDQPGQLGLSAAAHFPHCKQSDPAEALSAARSIMTAGFVGLATAAGYGPNNIVQCDAW